MLSYHVMPGQWSLETDDTGHTRVMHNGRDRGSFHSVKLAIIHIQAHVTPNEIIQFLTGLVADTRTDAREIGK